MHMTVLGLDFHLPGCTSLKEKRQRIGGIRDKFGRVPHLAICESGYQDLHQRAQFSIVAVGSSARVVEQTLADVERWVDECVDAVIVDISKEIIA